MIAPTQPKKPPAPFPKNLEPTEAIRIDRLPAALLKPSQTHVGLRIDAVIAQLMPKHRLSHIRQWCETGKVIQRGVRLRAHHTIRTLHPLEIAVRPAQDPLNRYPFLPEAFDFALRLVDVLIDVLT